MDVSQTVEEQCRYSALSNKFFDAVREKVVFGLTSILTLMEVLVLPLRAGRESLANDYRRLLGRTRGLTLFLADLAICERAAKARADHSWLRTPDALQVATALEQGAQVIVTDDSRWKG